MGNEQNYSYWLEIQEGSHVRFGDLPLLIAKAQHHDTNDELTSYLACSNLETELKQAVQSGALTVRNPLGLGPHTLPLGQALLDAVVLANDLEPLLNDKGIGLRIIGREGVSCTAPVNKTDTGTAQIKTGTRKVFSYVQTPHIREIPEELEELPPDALVKYSDWNNGSGCCKAAWFVPGERGRMERQQRGLFTPEEASLCLAKQEQWSASVGDSFLKKMLEAIRRGELVARRPPTNLPLDESERQKNLREFDDLIKVDELNQWLSGLGADYQWQVAATNAATAIETAEQRQGTAMLASKEQKSWDKTSPPEWIGLAREQAKAIIKDYKARDVYPNQITVADLIAKDFRARKIFGESGTPLNRATIKRHALQGISSATARQLSTTIKRGKRGNK